MTEKALKAQIERLQQQVDDLIAEQESFMQDHNTTVDCLQKHINANNSNLKEAIRLLTKRISKLELRGVDE